MRRTPRECSSFILTTMGAASVSCDVRMLVHTAGMSATNENFLRLFSNSSPGLRIKFRESDVDSKIVRVQHRLGPKPTAPSRDFLGSLCVQNSAREFCEFYRQHDGAEVCRTFDARHREERPLFQLMPAGSISAFTSRYTPQGDLSWIM